MFAAFYVNTELEARYIPFEWRLSPYLSARGGYRIALDEDYGDAPWRAGAGLGLDYSARSGFQTWLEIGGDFGFGESTDGGPLFQFGMGYRF